MSIKKAIGCLYGQLIGDALGCRYEFKCAADTQAMIAKDLNVEKFLAILGGGPFKLSPGQVRSCYKAVFYFTYYSSDMNVMVFLYSKMLRYMKFIVYSRNI